MDLRPAQERRFWAKVQVSAGCWEWGAAKNKHGYGKLLVSRRSLLAHRLSYSLLKGPIPVGLQLDHLCRNRACVNPAHLEPVTPLENTRRGLVGAGCLRGVNQNKAKLKDAEVIQIRDLVDSGLFTRVAVGKFYGVSPSLIGQICLGTYWKHIPLKPAAQLGG
jgi:hypothetical protein